VRSPTAGVVVEVVVLGFQVVGLLMAGSSRGEFSGGGEQSVVVVRLTAEARRRRSAAGQPGLDPR